MTDFQRSKATGEGGEALPYSGPSPAPHTLAPQSLRYVLSAAFCAVFQNTIMIVGDQAGYHYIPLTLLCYLTVGTTGYLLHVRFTFGQISAWPTYFRFMAGLAMSVPASLAIFAVLTTLFELPMPLASPIGTVLMICYNFISAKIAIERRVFGTNRPRSDLG